MAFNWATVTDGQTFIRNLNRLEDDIDELQRRNTTIEGSKEYTGTINAQRIESTDIDMNNNAVTVTGNLNGAQPSAYRKKPVIDGLAINFSASEINRKHTTENQDRVDYSFNGGGSYPIAGSQPTQEEIDEYASDLTATLNTQYDKIEQTVVSVNSSSGLPEKVEYYSNRTKVFEYNYTTGQATPNDYNYEIETVITTTFLRVKLPIGKIRIAVRYGYSVLPGNTLFVTNADADVFVKRARYPIIENQPIKVLKNDYSATEQRAITLSDYTNNRLA
jgi:hypothetical protein